MAFVSFSSQLVLENTTAVSNVFLNEYIPVCNGDCARVYLYGLYVCSAATRYDNTLEHFAANLNLSTEDIISAFTYWQDQGLVQILSVSPIEVKYLPIKVGNAKIKKYAKDKYADFNTQIQAIIEGRMITPTEFAEYYAFLESFHVEPAALIMTAKYCTGLKGTNIGHSYILTVAKNWAYAGIKTAETVREKLEIEQADLVKVTKILKEMKIKRAAEPTDFELFDKWTRKLGYSIEVITHVAKNARSVTKLDTLLLKYFELKLFERAEIDHYEKTKHDLTALAIAINKKIGVYYENVESIVENYITVWFRRGFDADTLLATATFCFKSGIRTLEGMDKVITKFYKLGLTSASAIDQFIGEKVAQGARVKELFARLNITREPNQFDRDFYNTWTTIWKFNDKIINYAATLAADKTSPIQYMNKVLSSYFEKKITTVEAAKKTSLPVTITPAKNASNFLRHSYSDSELGRLFSNLDEVEI